MNIFVRPNGLKQINYNIYIFKCFKTHSEILKIYVGVVSQMYLYLFVYIYFVWLLKFIMITGKLYEGVTSYCSVDICT